MENRVKELNVDQWKWLNKYDSINLKAWRFILLENKPLWCYVGDWKPTNIELYPSINDGGYKERQRNLENDRYYYWPK